MRLSKCLTSLASLASLLFYVQYTFGQNNKPNTQAQAPSPTGSIYQQRDIPTGDTVLNYIEIWRPQVPQTDNGQVQGSFAVANTYSSIEYDDGLGRPIQLVSHRLSPAGNDMVSPVAFDAFGRRQYDFLPYEASGRTGAFQTTAFADQQAFYTNVMPADVPGYKGEEVFYGHREYESSPLNRPVKILGPGNSWAGSERGTSIQYLVNDASDPVPVWTISSVAPLDANNWPTMPGNYPTGTLYKTVLTDEKGTQTVTYKDVLGRIVEKKVQAGAVVTGDAYTGWLVTCYVYDDMNRLRVVITPKGVTQLHGNGWGFTTAVIDGLCYRYEYDYRGRLLGKKAPGNGWDWLVYDSRDRQVFSQDSVLRVNNLWKTALYDGQDRAVLIGMTTYSGSQATLQQYVDGATASPTTGSYSNSATGVSGVVANLDVKTRQEGVASYTASNAIVFQNGFLSEPNANFTASIVTSAPATTTAVSPILGNPLPSGATFIPLAQYFYDDYSWGTSKAYNTTHNAQLDGAGNNPASLDALPATASTFTYNKPTGVRIRVIEDSANLGLGGWLETAVFYDDKGRPIQSIADNYKGGGDTLTMRYNFTNDQVSVYQAHRNPQAGIGSLKVRTDFAYDSTGRLNLVTEQLNDNPVTARAIAQFSYTRLGNLKTEQFGQYLTSGGAPAGSPLETQQFDYNIRGWLKGINRGFANPDLGVSGGNNWFGMDVAYDYGYDSTYFNGQASGIRWRSGANGEQRSFGYGYDRSGRLLFADFNQRFASTWTKTDPSGSGTASLNIDFSERFGDGSTYNTAYDDNGNLLSVHRMGLQLNASSLIDNLTYTYTGGSGNLLQAVSDSILANDHLEDFTDGNTSGSDYSYDGNGNLRQDLNKGITWIGYSFLDLPFQVNVHPSTGATGTITYIYDASGTKLEKRVHETPDATDGQQDQYTTTDYIGDFVYENNQLKSIGHEEGRIRPWNNDSGQTRIDTVTYDYFIPDHLGNTRVVLTDQHQTDVYPKATMEPGDATLEDAFYANVDETRAALPSGYPSDNTTSPNQYVAAVGGLQGTSKIGPSITLRVMARDTITMSVSDWYNTGGNTTSYLPLTAANLASALSSSLQGLAQEREGSFIVPVAGLLSPDAINFIAGQTSPPAGTPKAYLNWVFFDDQFRFVSQGSGSMAVGGNDATQVTPLVPLPQVATKSGYIYVYVSNADSLTTVYFDNLQVKHSRGPLAEEKHYYAFGLDMPGISSAALDFAKTTRHTFNGNEQQRKEFSDGSGLEAIDFNARTYDPQLGRFWQVDPMTETMRRWSPYAFGFDNPVGFSDPYGLTPGDSTPAYVPPMFQGEVPASDPTDASGQTLAPIFIQAPGSSSADDGTLGGGALFSQPNLNTQGTAPNTGGSSSGHGFWRSVGQTLLSVGENLPFAGGVIQITEGIVEGDMTKVLMGTLTLTADIATAGEGGILVHAGEALVKDGIEVAARDEIEDQINREVVTELKEQATAQANRNAGNEFRDQLADALRNEGRNVKTEVYKKTPFGKRYIDIEVRDAAGEPIGGIETKVGGSRYHTLQRLKDAWLYATEGYRVELVRKPPNW